MLYVKSSGNTNRKKRNLENIFQVNHNNHGQDHAILVSKFYRHVKWSTFFDNTFLFFYVDQNEIWLPSYVDFTLDHVEVVSHFY